MQGEQGIESAGRVRKGFAETWQVLQERGYAIGGEVAVLPGRMPHPLDEGPQGISFFRTVVSDDVLKHLTMPRSLFCRSAIEDVLFVDTDLSESWMCWNDFTCVDFTDADLSGCDMRASDFHDVRFLRTRLDGADLRHSLFTRVLFKDASLRGTHLTHAQGKTLRLSPTQIAEIAWHEEDGEEPEGG